LVYPGKLFDLLITFSSTTIPVISIVKGIMLICKNNVKDEGGIIRKQKSRFTSGETGFLKAKEAVSIGIIC
jgi:hypothetical protein